MVAAGRLAEVQATRSLIVFVIRPARTPNYDGRDARLRDGDSGHAVLCLLPSRTVTDGSGQNPAVLSAGAQGCCLRKLARSELRTSSGQAPRSRLPVAEVFPGGRSGGHFGGDVRA